jgi:glycosyl transferase family 25
METIPTYVINLENSEQDYLRVKKEFSGKGVDVQRFIGVYGKALDKDYIKSVLHPYALCNIKSGSTIHAEFHTLGAVGCALSHIKLWQKLLESDSEMFHVLEDDAVIKTDISTINQFIKTVPDDWDIIYLGFLSNILDKRKDIKISDNVYKINRQTFQTQSYIINRKGAEKLLAKAFPIIHHIDSYMSFCAMEGGVNAYRPKSSYIPQRLRRSQIQENVLNLMQPHLNLLPAPFSWLCIFIALYVVIAYVVKLFNKR